MFMYGIVFTVFLLGARCVQVRDDALNNMSHYTFDFGKSQNIKPKARQQLLVDAPNGTSAQLQQADVIEQRAREELLYHSLNGTSVESQQAEIIQQKARRHTLDDELNGTSVESRQSSSTTETFVSMMIILAPIGFLCCILVVCVGEDNRPQTKPQGEPMQNQGQAFSRDLQVGNPIRGYVRQSRPMSPIVSSGELEPPAFCPASPPPGNMLGPMLGLQASTLCPEFIVSAPKGVVYSIPDVLKAIPQDLTLDICDHSGGGHIIAHAVASESMDGLIRLETSYPGNRVLATLDTTFASRSVPAAHGNRYAILFRPAADRRYEATSAPFAVFFLSRAHNGASLVVRLGESPSRSRPLMSAQLDANCTVRRILDANQRTLAVGADAPDTSHGGIAIRVLAGADAALVLCAVIAAQKLR